MTHRVTKGVSRPSPVQIEVNGTAILAYEGESIATALMASGRISLSRDKHGEARGPFCNMGVCYDCVVLLHDQSGATGTTMRARSCLTLVRAGMRITIAD